MFKPEIREKIQLRRRQLSAASIEQASQAVAAQLIQLPEFLDATHIASYLSIDGELDTWPLMQGTAALKKQWYLPMIASDVAKNTPTLQFHAYRIGDTVIKNRHGIEEPETQSPQMAPQDLSAILMPLVAFDAQGNRLGRGAGHYDRTLAFINEPSTIQKPILIGLAYEFQKISAMTPDQWDVPLDIVVTEQSVYKGASLKL